MNPSVFFAAQAAQPQGAGPSMLVPFIGMFVIMYFFLFRPQMRKQRQHDNMVKALSPKDKVVMNSGLFGTVVKVNEHDIILEVADKMHLKFQRSAVATVRNGSGDQSSS